MFLKIVHIWVIYTEKWNAVLKTKLTAVFLWIPIHFVLFKIQFYILFATSKFEFTFISILNGMCKLQQTLICQWPLSMYPRVIKERYTEQRPQQRLFSRFPKLAECNVLCVSHLTAFARFHWITRNGDTNSKKQHCDTQFVLSRNPLFWCRSA